MKSEIAEQDSYGLPQGAVIPEHIAIIMDGNGRWAKSKGLPRIAGHRAGVDSVREIVEVAAEIGVKYLTLYTFSTENWKRPKDEVSTLMTLLVRTLRKEINELHKNNVRLNTIGDFNMLPEKVQEEFSDAIERTAGNSRLNLNLALSYSGRWEIIEAVRKIASDASSGIITPGQISDELFSSYLTTKGMPDPELLIRTSGEFRVSNFLLWQIAYSEIYICNTYWPEFRKKNFIEAILDFQKRERRFGKVSEQLQKEIKRN
ncbi:MAG: isoprenyl transferase [Ignavibacteriaceae bacterium]|nr:isoprenyl transferase [Ignavibacteriaceae bacterium]